MPVSINSSWKIKVQMHYNEIIGICILIFQLELIDTGINIHPTCPKYSNSISANFTYFTRLITYSSGGTSSQIDYFLTR